MRKTELYRLNQWDPDDRIRREDFNADNAAIENALKSLSASTPPEQLHLFREPNVRSSWSKPFEKITDWSRWNIVVGLIGMDHNFNNKDSSTLTFYVMDRTVGSVAYDKGLCQFQRLKACSFGIFVFLVGHDPDRRAQGFFISPSKLAYFTSACTFREFGSGMELSVYHYDEAAKMDVTYWVYGIE